MNKDKVANDILKKMAELQFASGFASGLVDEQRTNLNSPPVDPYEVPKEKTSKLAGLPPLMADSFIVKDVNSDGTVIVGSTGTV